MIFFVRLFLFLILLITPFTVLANSGLSFLKIGPTAREQAMGNTGSASSEGSSNIYYNPALLPGSGPSTIGFSQNFWLLDTYATYLSSQFIEKTTAYGVALTWLSVRDIPIRIKPTSVPEGYFNSQNAALNLAYARRYSDLSVGITLKLIYEKYYLDDASGYGFDLSGAYHFSPQLKLGLSLQNIGSMSELQSVRSTLPTLLRGGFAYSLTLPALKSILHTELNFLTVFSEETSLHFGHEFEYNALFFARLGYVFGNDSRSFSAGFGITYQQWRIDYAYIPFSNQLGAASLFTLEFQY